MNSTLSKIKIGCIKIWRNDDEEESKLREDLHNPLEKEP